MKSPRRKPWMKGIPLRWREKLSTALVCLLRPASSAASTARPRVIDRPSVLSRGLSQVPAQAAGEMPPGQTGAHPLGSCKGNGVL